MLRGKWTLPVTMVVVFCYGACGSMEVVVVAAPELVRNAPEARPCIFPAQGHRKPLAEHDGTGAIGLELAASQG